MTDLTPAAEAALTEALMAIEISDHCESLQAATLRALREAWDVIPDGSDGSDNWWAAIAILERPYRSPHTTIGRMGIAACAAAATVISTEANTEGCAPLGELERLEAATAMLGAIAAHLRYAAVTGADLNLPSGDEAWFSRTVTS